MKILDTEGDPFEEGQKAYRNNLKLEACVYRPDSLGEDEWIAGWRHAKKSHIQEDSSRAWYSESYDNDDEFYLDFHWVKLTEKTGIYQGHQVKLDNPRYSDSDEDKRFVVYVDSGEKTEDGKIKAKKVTFGSDKDSDLRVRKDDEEARKNFVARHNCDTANDKTTARYWSCRAPLSKSDGKYW